MRIGILCTQCASERQNEQRKLYWAEVTNDGAHHLDCQYGHKNVYLLQEHKFELLFELGLNAIIDSYYREAVSSFASCLERFYEFAVGVLTANANIDGADFEACWSIVAKQSERQVGAFVFAYLLSERRKPKLLPEKLVSFRNDVIHRGRIPTRDEALHFGTMVLEVIFEPLKILRNKYPEQCAAVTVASVTKVREALEAQGHTVTGFTYPMTLRNIRPDTDHPPVLSERVARVAKIMRPSGSEP